MSLQHRRSAVDLRRSLPGLRSQVVRVIHHLHEDVSTDCHMILSEISHQLSNTLQIVCDKNSSNSLHIGLVLDDISSDCIMTVVQASALVTFLCLSAEPVQYANYHTGSLLLDYVVSPSDNPLSSRHMLGSNLNEPGLKEYCTFVATIISTVCSIISSGVSHSSEVIYALLKVTQNLLYILRKCIINFPNNRKAYSVLCDNFLDSSLTLYGIEDVIVLCSLKCDKDSRAKELFQAIKHFLNDILQVGLFADASCNELMSIPFNPAALIANAHDLKNMKKRKYSDVQQSDNSASFAIKYSSFAGRIYEVIGDYFNRSMSKRSTKLGASAVAALWKCFATSRFVDGIQGQDKSAKPKLSTKVVEGGDRDESSSSRRKQLMHNIHFALSLFHHTAYHCQHTKQSDSSIYLGGIYQVAAALLESMIYGMGNESLPQHSSFEKYVSALKELWQQCRTTALEIHQANLSDHLKCFVLAPLLDVVRLIQLVDHRVAFDCSRQALQLAFCDYGMTQCICDTQGDSKKLMNEHCNSCLSGVEKQHNGSYDQYFRSKTALIRDMWNLFSNLRCLDHLLRIVLPLIVDDKSNWLTIDGLNSVFKNGMLLKRMFDSILLLPAGQWDKVWNIILEERLTLFSRSNELDMSDTKCILPIGFLQSTVLAMVFEAQHKIVKSTVKLFSNPNPSVILEDLDAHTKGLGCLLFHLVISLNMVCDKWAFSNITRHQYEAVIYSQLKLLSSLIHYLLRVYSNQYQLLDVTICMKSLSIPSQNGCLEDNDAILVLNERCQYSCLELLKTHAMAMLSNIEALCLERGNFDNVEENCMTWEALHQAKFSYAQLLINIDGKLPSLQCYKELKDLTKSIISTFSAVQEKEPCYEVCLFKTIVQNMHIFTSMSKFAARFGEKSETFLSSAMASTLDISSKQKSELLTSLVNNIIDLLSSTTIMDVSLVWNAVMNGIIQMLEKDHRFVDLIIPIYRIVINSDVYSINFGAKLVHACIDAVSVISKGKRVALQDYDRFRMILGIWSRSLQNILKLCRSDISILNRIHLVGETNIITLQLMDVATKFYDHADECTFISQSIYNDCIKIIVVFHHLRLQHCLSQHASCNHKSLDIYLEQLSSLDLIHSDQVYGSDSLLTGWSEEFRLKVLSILLKDIVVVLHSSNCSAETIRYVNNFASNHIERLCVTHQHCKFHSIALWLALFRDIDSTGDIPEKFRDTVLHEVFTASERILKNETGKSAFLSWSLLFKIAGDSIAQHICCKSNSNIQFDAAAASQLFHLVGLIWNKYVTLFANGSTLVDHDDPVVIYVGEGLHNILIGILNCLSTTNINLIDTHQIGKRLTKILRFSICVVDDKQLSSSALRVQLIKCKLLIMTELLVRLAKTRATEGTTSIFSEAFGDMFDDILSIFSQGIHEAVELSENPDREYSNAGSLLHFVTHCTTNIDKTLFQLLTYSRASVEMSNHEWEDDGDNTSTYQFIDLSSIIKSWTKRSLSIIVMTCDKLYDRCLAMHCSAIVDAPLEDLISCFRNQLVLHNGMISFAIRGQVTNFCSKLPHFASSTAKLIFILASLESTNKDGMVQNFARQGFQIVARVLTNVANIRDCDKHLSFLITRIVQVLANISTMGSANIDKDADQEGVNKQCFGISLSKACKEILYPGLFALFEKLNLKQKGQVFKLLDGTSRVVMTDIHDEFMRNYKFHGN